MQTTSPPKSKTWTESEWKRAVGALLKRIRDEEGLTIKQFTQTAEAGLAKIWDRLEKGSCDKLRFEYIDAIEYALTRATRPESKSELIELRAIQYTI